MRFLSECSVTLVGDITSQLNTVYHQTILKKKKKIFLVKGILTSFRNYFLQSSQRFGENFKLFTKDVKDIIDIGKTSDMTVLIIVSIEQLSQLTFALVKEQVEFDSKKLIMKLYTTIKKHACISRH